MADRGWAIHFRKAVKADGSLVSLQITIPQDVAKTLHADGYVSADLRITDEGLLLIPSRQEARYRRTSVRLPAYDGVLRVPGDDPAAFYYPPEPNGYDGEDVDLSALGVDG